MVIFEFGKGQNVHEPHDFFCLFPRTVWEDGREKLVWLETITRQWKQSMVGGFWVYKRKEQ